MILSPAKKSIRDLFNQLAAPYARQALGRRQAENRADLSWIRPRARDRVLDLACGPGTLAVELSRCCRETYGLDLAEQMIARARRAARQRRCQALHLLVGDSEATPFPQEFFDLVVCSFSFASFPTPEGVAREIWRVSRRGARIALVEVAASEDPTERAHANKLEQRRSGTPMRLLSLSELLGLFRGMGCELEDCSIHRRRHRLEDWLALSHPAARSHLRSQFLRQVPRSGDSLWVERLSGRCYLYQKVARLLWRKPA